VRGQQCSLRRCDREDIDVQKPWPAWSRSQASLQAQTDTACIERLAAGNPEGHQLAAVDPELAGAGPARRNTVAVLAAIPGKVRGGFPSGIA